MKEKFEVEGYWCLPDKQDTKIFGQLTFTPGKTPELKLQGTLTEQNPIFQSNVIKLPIILGETSTKSKDVALYKCQQSGYVRHGNGLETTSFIAEAAFIGVQFEHVDDVKFR